MRYIRFQVWTFVLSLALHEGCTKLCFNCDRIAHPWDCQKVVQCDAVDSCYVERVVTPGNHIYYNSGCLDKQQCKYRAQRLFKNKRSIDGKRTFSPCVECCDHDACNMKQCDAGVPPAISGLFCLQCNDVVDPSHCEDIVVCGRDDLCYVQEFMTLHLEKRYRLGCFKKHMCASFTGTPSGEHCTKCCTESYCNGRLCSGNHTALTTSSTPPVASSITTITNPFTDINTTVLTSPQSTSNLTGSHRTTVTTYPTTSFTEQSSSENSTTGSHDSTLPALSTPLGAMSSPSSNSSLYTATSMSPFGILLNNTTDTKSVSATSTNTTPTQTSGTLSRNYSMATNIQDTTTTETYTNLSLPLVQTISTFSPNLITTEETTTDTRTTSGKPIIGVSCFSCDHIVHPWDCDQLASCDVNENCFVDQKTSTTGHIYYDIGCRDKKRCSSANKKSAIQKRMGVARKSASTTCSKCCDKDGCNNLGFCDQAVRPNITGVLCMSCGDVEVPNDCAQTILCRDDQVCHTQEYKTIFSEKRFRLGCKQKSDCVTLNKSLPDNRQQGCNSCCNENYCNKHLCSSKEPITPQPTGVIISTTVHSKSTSALTKTTNSSHQVTSPALSLETKTTNSSHQVTSPALSLETKTANSSYQVTSPALSMNTKTTNSSYQITTLSALLSTYENTSMSPWFTTNGTFPMTNNSTRYISSLTSGTNWTSSSFPSTNSTTPISTLFPVPLHHSCDFEQDLCSWTQSHFDDFDWMRYKFETPTYGTGPRGDHTLGGQGFYVYIESSAPRHRGDTALFVSPELKPGRFYCINFWYNMHGQGIGGLSLSNYLQNQQNYSAPFWATHVDHGDAWQNQKATVPIQYEPFNIVFNGTVGSRFSDVAIDDIMVENGTC